MPNLDFFSSVPINEATKEPLQGLEKVLQQEHKSDGTHPIASPSESGFMSAEDKQRLDAIWNWIEEQRTNSGT